MDQDPFYYESINRQEFSQKISFNGVSMYRISKVYLMFSLPFIAKGIMDFSIRMPKKFLYNGWCLKVLIATTLVKILTIVDVFKSTVTQSRYCLLGFIHSSSNTCICCVFTSIIAWKWKALVYSYWFQWGVMTSYVSSLVQFRLDSIAWFGTAL